MIAVLLTAALAQAPALVAATKLLPREPQAVVVVGKADERLVRAAAAWGAKPEHVRAFVLTGDERTVYVNRNVDPYRCAGERTICTLLLAAAIWHEMGHLEGLDELEAQEREEELFRQFVTENRIGLAEGQHVLAVMESRRSRR